MTTHRRNPQPPKEVEPPPKPVPLTILTGFLGAGKTTLLNRILNAEHGLRVAVLVNDFGAVNIDSRLIVGVEGEGETVSLSNGCICCTIRGDLLDATVALMGRPEPPEYVLVEASGVSDPGEVARTFLLVPAYVQVDSIITVVDSEQFHDLEGKNAILALDQVGVADIIVLNKVDVATPAQLEDVRDYIRQVSPRARIIETTFGQAPLELLLGVGAYDPERLAQRAPLDIHVHAEEEAHDHDHDHNHDHDHDHVHHDHTLVFNTWTYTCTDEPLSFQSVRRVLRQLPNNIFRAKGVLHLDEIPDRQGIVQVVGKRARATVGEPWGDQTPRSELVFIGEAGTLDVQALQTQLDNCRASRVSTVREVLNGVVDWIRGV